MKGFNDMMMLKRNKLGSKRGEARAHFRFSYHHENKKSSELPWCVRSSLGTILGVPLTGALQLSETFIDNKIVTHQCLAKQKYQLCSYWAVFLLLNHESSMVH
jgi:hypothetical protein